MVARTHSAPSSSCGMNSAPMRGISSSEPASSSGRDDRRPPLVRQADIQTIGVDRLDRLEDARCAARARPCA